MHEKSGDSGKGGKVVKVKGQVFSYHFITFATLPLGLTALLMMILLINVPCWCSFEELGAGARPIGMGSAFTALSDDAHAIYYNPAGLAQVRRGELTAGYGQLFVGLKDGSNLGSGFVGVVQSLKEGSLGTVGLGWTSLSLQGAYREDMISFSYGKEIILDGLFVGGNGKVLKRSFGSDIYTQADPVFRGGQNTSNPSFDLGVMYRPTASYSFGMMIKDMNQPDVGLAGQDRIPLEIRGGFGYHQRQLSFDGEIWRRSSDVDVAMGLEKWLMKVVGLRAGFVVGSRSRREIATGMSYRGGYFSVDYAFVFPLAGVESTAGSHRFGITVKFGKEAPKARWEFEDEENVMEKLLEEKTTQIEAMEKELETLKDQNRAGKLEDTWVRQQLKNLEDKLSQQESRELEDMRNRLFQSNYDTEKMRKRILELEDRIRRMSEDEKRITSPARQAPAVVPVPQAAPQPPRTYMVKEGDTLQSIAQKVYNDPAKWVQIYEMNSDRIERGGTVRPGQVLLLPEK